jgi:arylformamidase
VRGAHPLRLRSPRRHPAADWYDEQYNNRARIPEHLAILQRWSDESGRARAALAGIEDVPYGSDPSERLDIFPAGVANAPVMVYLHGGYWRALDKRDQTFVALPFVAAGAMCVLPNYALCPAVGIEHIALQLVRALSWVFRHAADYGGDPDRIVVGGHSAGGHLATMLLACDWPAVAPGLPPDLVTSAMSISGLYELEPLRHAPFLAADLHLSAASARRLSPALMPPPRRPLVTVVGADESAEFLRQADAISHAWGPRTVIGSETVRGRHHMDVLHEVTRPTSCTHRWALRLLGIEPGPAHAGRARKPP